MMLPGRSELVPVTMTPRITAPVLISNFCPTILEYAEIQLVSFPALSKKAFVWKYGELL